MAIVDIHSIDPALYLQAKWRWSIRQFQGMGFNVPIEVCDITKLTHLDREEFRVPDVEELHLMYNPIVVCKMTLEQWEGPRKGNIPFRDRSLKKILDDGYIYCISRGNQRVSSAIAVGYRYIDAYVCNTMEETYELGIRIKDEYESLCREKPDKYRNYVYPTRTK